MRAGGCCCCFRRLLMLQQEALELGPTSATLPLTCYATVIGPCSVFSARPDATIPAGSVGLNAIQRKVRPAAAELP